MRFALILLLLTSCGACVSTSKPACFHEDRCEGFPLGVDCGAEMGKLFQACLEKGGEAEDCKFDYIFGVGYCSAAKRTCDPNWTVPKPTVEEESEPTKTFDKNHT